MIDHLNEAQLEKLLLTPDDLEADEQRGFEAHLDGCSLCQEHMLKLRQFYNGVRAELENPPTERDREMAEGILASHRKALPSEALQRQPESVLEAYAEVIEPYRRPLAHRFIRYVRVHPVRFAGATSLAAALVLAFLFVRPHKDMNQAYARAKDEFLVTYNKNGDELWRKHIGTGYDSEKLRTGIPTYEPDKYLVTVDIDGDHDKEVIAAFGLFNASSLWPMRNAVVCYNADGSNRWVSKLGRKMTFGTELFSDDYRVRQILVMNRNKAGAVEILASFGHDLYYPSGIARLDPSMGRVLDEYWHSGNLAALDYRDIDGDGIAELLAVGENNAYDMASLAVLDSGALSGHSPALLTYTPQGVPVGTEKCYLLFPRCDVQKAAAHKRNVTQSSEVLEDGLLRVGVAERVDNSWYPILYFFNSSMKCIRVEGEDTFINLHRRLEAEGKLTRKLDAQYYDELRQGVLYWDGEKFTHEPTMNKNYHPAVAGQ